MPDNIVKIKMLVEGLKDAQTAQKTWDDWKKEVAATNKTLDDTKKSIQAVTQQMQIQRTVNGKLTETQKQERQGMQLALVALKELKGEREQEAAAEREAAEAVRYNQEKAREAILNRIRANEELASTIRQTWKLEEEAAKATQKSSGHWLKHARTLAFWAIGAASTYRLIQKLKRVLSDVVKALVENTVEWGRVKDEIKEYQAIAVKVFEPEIREAIGVFAESLELTEGNAIRAAAAFRILKEEIFGTKEEASDLSLILTVSLVAAYELLIEQIRKSTGLSKEQFDLRLMKEAAELTKRVHAANEVVSKKTTERVDKQNKLYEEQIKLLEKLIDAEKKRIEETLDLLEELRQREEDLAIERRRAYEDLAIDQARSLEDIEIKYQRDLEDIRDDAGEERVKAEERLRLKLLQIEMRYRERLIRIEEDFQDAIDDAIRTRDATAALQAIRRRSRDIGRAKRERDNDRTLAHEQYESQLREQERALERRREDAARARQRALEDLRRDLEREREDIERNFAREMDDLNLFLERRLAEIDLDYQRQLAEANEFYSEDKREYRDYLREKLAELQNYYNNVVKVAAATRAAQAGISMPSYSYSGAGGRGTKKRAAGGIDYFTSPTIIQVAEAGRPEWVVTIPASPTGQPMGANINANISGQVSAVMSGFEGRFTAMAREAVLGVVGELLQ